MLVKSQGRPAESFFQDLEGGVGRRPRAEGTAAAPGIGDEFEDGEAAQGLARGAGDFFRDGKAAEFRDGDAGFGRGVRGREGADEGGADGAACDEEMGETVEEREIGFWPEGDVDGGGPGGLRGAGGRRRRFWAAGDSS